LDVKSIGKYIQLDKFCGILRERRGLTQGEVAQRARLPQQAISRLERGEREHVRSDVLARLAVALTVSADYLLGLQDCADDAEPPPPQPRRQRTRKAALMG
jgi:transcriptional regulator with XRE-family HTH domain